MNTKIDLHPFLIIVVLLLLIGMGVSMRLNTTIGQKDQVIAARDQEINTLQAHVSTLQGQLEPDPYSLPLKTLWISSGTGYRMDPMGGATERLHKGVDLVGPIGTPIQAVMAGLVMEHWLTPGIHNGKQYFGHPTFGAMIILKHKGGLFSIYGHLSTTFIHEGEWVEKGQVIGELGNTGISTGAHLHFEVVVDPLKYLEGR